MRRTTLTLILAFGLVPGLPGGATAQDADAHLIPRGLLRIGFEPHYTNYDRRFAMGSSLVADGELEFIGADLTSDSAGADLFPALVPVEQAVRDITGNPGYRMNIGQFKAIRDADIRRFGFTFALGLTDRITITATLPVVTHRSQITFTADSTEANAGFNQALAVVAGSGNPAMIAALFSELTAAIAAVRAAIAAGSFGCPGTTQCDQAAAAAGRGDRLLMNLQILAGSGTGPNLASFAPLATSAEGAAITAEIAAVAAELTAFGGTAIGATFSLPANGIGRDDINGNLLSDSSLGYAAAPLDFVRGTSLGDVELGIRVGVIQEPGFRLVVRGEARLPTATLDSPNNFIDFGTGDRQLDLEGGLEAALLASRSFGLNLAASYTYQTPHTLARRVGPPSLPIRPASALQTVSRDPGEMLRLTAYPTLRLAPGFRVFGLVNYFRKSADRYEAVSGTNAPAAGAGFPVASLGEESRMEALSFGGGVAYRSEFTPGGGSPIEAGLNYQSAFSGSGGLTPRANQLRLYLRLYRNIFAGGAEPSPEPVSPPEAR